MSSWFGWLWDLTGAIGLSVRVHRHQILPPRRINGKVSDTVLVFGYLVTDMNKVPEYWLAYFDYEESVWREDSTNGVVRVKHWKYP